MWQKSRATNIMWQKSRVTNLKVVSEVLPRCQQISSPGENDSFSENCGIPLIVEILD